MNSNLITKADDAAADWAARLDGAPLSPREERELALWLAADPTHHPKLDSVLRLYGRLGEAVPRLAAENRLTAPTISRAPRFNRWAASFAIAAALVLGTVWFVRRPENFTTHAAQRQTITLADGSVLELNAETSVAVRLHSTDRRVQLAQGEAFFAVAKDKARPFFVETPAGTVRVTGTAFNVRSSGAGQLEVTVTEGQVAVTPGGEAAPAGTGFNLVPQDQLTFDGARSAVRQLSVEATADALAWREGRVVFESEPLGSAVQRFARYHAREINVAPEIARLELGGRFKLDELDQFLSDVAKTLPVQVLRSSSGPIRILPR